MWIISGYLWSTRKDMSAQSETHFTQFSATYESLVKQSKSLPPPLAAPADSLWMAALPVDRAVAPVTPQVISPIGGELQQPADQSVDPKEGRHHHSDRNKRKKKRKKTHPRYAAPGEHQDPAQALPDPPPVPPPAAEERDRAPTVTVQLLSDSIDRHRETMKPYCTKQAAASIPIAAPATASPAISSLPSTSPSGIVHQLPMQASPQEYYAFQPVSASVPNTPQTGIFSAFEDFDDVPHSTNGSEDEFPDQPCASCCVDSDSMALWYLNASRRHAFQFPLHSYQISAAIVKIVGHATFWASVVPGLVLVYKDDNDAALIEVIVFSVALMIFSCFLYAAWVLVSFTDCTDHGTTGGDLCVYCRCRTQVDSKHCKACNKCVIGFDHHCKWLNMCIGSKNYRIFVCYMVSATLSMSTALISAVVFLTQWWTALGAHSVYFKVLPFFLIVLMCIGLPPIIQLLGFHAMLNMKHMTTYRYILEKRKREAERRRNEGGTRLKKNIFGFSLG